MGQDQEEGAVEHTGLTVFFIQRTELQVLENTSKRGVSRASDMSSAPIRFGG